MKHFRTVTLALCVALLGCSDDASLTESPNLGGTLSRDDYAARLAEWICDDLAACCDVSGRSFDHGTCVAIYRNKQLNRLEAEERHGIRAFDGLAAAECTSLIETTPADCNGRRRRIRKCFQTYDGRKESGAACERKIECKGSRRGEMTCIDGRCGPRREIGAICSRSGCDGCRLDTRCRISEDGESRCYGYSRRRGVAGDSCTTTSPLSADARSVSIVQTDCLEEDGLYCARSGVCEPFIPLGGECTGSFDPGCESGSYCRAGVCAPGVGVGESCEALVGCARGLHCQFRVARCELDSVRNDRCSSFELFDGRCTEPLAEGEQCRRYIQCPNGFEEDCLDETTCAADLACGDDGTGVERCQVVPDFATRRCANETVF